MGNEKINSLLQEMLKLSQVTNYSDFVIFNPKLIYNKHRLFLKNPTDRLYEGSFHGLLFENYATNILLKAVDKLESIEWIVHILQPQKKMKAKEIKELNCLAYDNEGSIILFRDGYNHAEFDGILSINNQIVLLEMKNITSKNKYPIKKLDTRINKFTSAFKIESIVLTIFGQNKFSTEYQDRGKIDPDFHNFYLPNFDKFLKYFSKHHKKMRKRESISNRKQKTPKQVFGRTIKYQIHMKILWNELLKNKKLKSFENFWRQVHYSAKLIGKQPVGYLDPMINFSKYDSQSKINIQNYLELGLTCVVFVRFNEPILGIEIAVCIESNTKQIHRIPESEFSFDEMRFLKITKSLADLSINYKLAMNFKNNYPDEKFDLDKFTFLIQRCMELTN